MNNLFHYESKLMQSLMVLADYIILNFLYVLCCIPVFTIGAAQAGLYNGLRILQDKDNDTSCVKAFFRGFRSGFGTITLVWGIVSLITLALGYNILAVYVFKSADFRYATLPFVLSIIGAVIAMIYQSMIPLFHAYFSCTARQLIKNVFLVIMANPIQSILIALINWLPVIILGWRFDLFVQSSIILFFLYYSIAFGFSIRLINKSFTRLINNFNDPKPTE